jgi:hypothetical protein
VQASANQRPLAMHNSVVRSFARQASIVFGLLLGVMSIFPSELAAQGRGNSDGGDFNSATGPVRGPWNSANGSGGGGYAATRMSDPLSGSSGDGYTPPSRPFALPIFFPPLPPPLGAPIPQIDLQSAWRTRTPATLEEYVNELFYPALGSRLALHRLSARQKEKIQAYRAEKIALQNELRDRLTALKAADPATRERELAELARLQAPRLAALEKTAEQLRQELVHGEFFQENVDWNMIRDWRLGKARFSTTDGAMAAQYQVMLAAAFYQTGLLVEQRGLLREIAYELRTVKRTMSEENLAHANPPLFFSPATARLRLPPGLPVELREKIARYERERSMLKQELRDAIYAQDRAFFASTRKNALEALAQRQAPRFVALEELAEEIRRDFARLPDPMGPPPLPPLPAAFAARVMAFVSEKNAIKATVVDKIQQIKTDFNIQRVYSVRNPTGGGSDLRMVITPSEQSEEQMKTLRTTLQRFNQDIALRQKDLRQKEEEIRRDFAALADREEGRSLEDLLDDYADILQQREEWRLYADYENAVLTPGLSPAQRRLLYDAGVEKLDLPLPPWEPIMIGIAEV